MRNYADIASLTFWLILAPCRIFPGQVVVPEELLPPSNRSRCNETHPQPSSDSHWWHGLHICELLRCMINISTKGVQSIRGVKTEGFSTGGVFSFNNVAPHTISIMLCLHLLSLRTWKRGSAAVLTNELVRGEILHCKYTLSSFSSSVPNYQECALFKCKTCCYSLLWTKMSV